MRKKGVSLAVWIGKDKEEELIGRLDELASIVGTNRNKLIVRILEAFTGIYHGETQKLKTLQKEIQELRERILNLQKGIIKPYREH